MRLVFLLVFFCGQQVFSQHHRTDVLIVGGGASGVMAGIQAARSGASVLVLESTPWLGGMLTSAGVSAIDGNHNLPSGLWGEFRTKLYRHYGGPQQVKTGWVSKTLFEPSVGNQILREMVANEPNLKVLYNANWETGAFHDKKWKIRASHNKKKITIESFVLIDATELGDVMAQLGVPYDVGMDSKERTGESFAPDEANDIIQDMTYVVTLKDYGRGANKTIKKPKGYNAIEFEGSCDVSDPATFESGNNDCQKMIQYARLPNDKYMINWPKKGNDIYLNIIEMSRREREKALEAAKLHSLRFVYYIQTVLGMRHLGIAKEEYPTKDGLPMIPYHRESRRMHGQVQLTLDHVLEPYNQELPLYRTGITVGDYTIDHHHLKRPDAPEIDFVKIRVPSYNVPAGALIPKGFKNLIVAEKSISVSNIVNGATRLQPVVMGIGQAAGALAALSVREQKSPGEIDVRRLQQELLDAKVFLMPFIDVQPSDPWFGAVQRIGATGILKGFGVPYQWANQTWFYPERPVSEYELVDGLRPYYPELSQYWDASGEPLTLKFLLNVFQLLNKKVTYADVEQNAGLALQQKPAPNTELTRLSAAVLVDHYLSPFSHNIQINGTLN